jgi:hypothetical protein
MGASTPDDIEFMRTVPYLSCIGLLQYLASMTHSDIAQVIAYLARFNSNPGLKHWAAVKHLSCYLKGMLEHKLHYLSSVLCRRLSKQSRLNGCRDHR